MTSPSEPRVGRPPVEVPDEVRERVIDLAARMGSAAAARVAGISERQVRKIWSEEGCTRLRRRWTEEEDLHLLEHAGEQSVPRLARVLERSEPAVRWRLWKLGISVEEQRTDMTIRQVADVVGRDESWVRGRIERKQLSARKQDGAWRIYQSSVREWVRADPSVVQWKSVGEWGFYLVAILAGDA